MSIISNKIISQEYRVSSTTVLNWIENAINKKNNLHVEKVGKKYKITDNANNRTELESLTGIAKIYKNKIEMKKIAIDESIYNFFSRDQLIELISSLSLHKRIPLKFSYLGKGARLWEKFADTGKKLGKYQTSLKTPLLLKKILPLILDRTRAQKKINIIDLGTGTSSSMTDIAKYFFEMGLLKTYVGVDISEELLNISKKNIENINKEINYKKYVFDIEKSDFLNILFENKSEDAINLVFFIGCTIGNMENIHRTLENLRYSLGLNDLLIISNKIDTIEKRTQFEPLALNNPHSWIVQELGIDILKAKMGTEYDKKSNRRRGYFLMDKDYIIDFKKVALDIKICLYKDEKVVFWYHEMSTRESIIRELDIAGLELLDLTTTDDLSHLVVVTKSKDESII